MARAKKAGGKAEGTGTPAATAAAGAGIAFTLHPYETDAGAADWTAAGPSGGAGIRPSGGAKGYGEAAADALGVPYERLFKTLLAEVDGALTVAVVPVAATLDLKALAAAAGGKKAQMADARVAERATGYVVGGISPLGQRRRLPTIVDASASGFSTIFVSAGRRGLQIELAPADLIRLTRARAAAIAKR
jgi:Cys-tRNA(Pro)/Cys-tRNA(Cys) deacylase